MRDLHPFLRSFPVHDHWSLRTFEGVLVNDHSRRVRVYLHAYRRVTYLIVVYHDVPCCHKACFLPRTTVAIHHQHPITVRHLVSPNHCPPHLFVTRQFTGDIFFSRPDALSDRLDRESHRCVGSTPFWCGDIAEPCRTNTSVEGHSDFKAVVEPLHEPTAKPPTSLPPPHFAGVHCEVIRVPPNLMEDTGVFRHILVADDVLWHFAQNCHAAFVGNTSHSSAIVTVSSVFAATSFSCPTPFPLRMNKSKSR